jgi:hypothetical protein
MKNALKRNLEATFQMSYTVLNTFMYWHFCSYFYTKREFSLLGKAIYIPTTKGNAI